MHDLKFFTYVAMVIIGSIMLGYSIAIDNKCTSDHTIFQCLSKETK